MATKTIDKLRIQGNAAPRRGPEVRRPFRHLTLHDADAPSHFIFQTDAGSVVNGSDITTIVNSHPSSAASRKHDHLQRVQQANKGLTSAEFGSLGREGLPSIHFLLRGKPVQGDVEVTPIDTLKHQRVGHYKTSAKEVYRARHKVQSDLSSSGDYTNVFRAIRTPFNDGVENINFTNSNNHTNSVATGNLFYLGPSVSGQHLHQTWPTRRGVAELTSSAPSVITRGSQREMQSLQHNNDSVPWYENTDDSETGRYMTFTGQPYPTPRGSPQAEEMVDIGDTPLLTNAPKYYLGTSSMPDMLNAHSTPALNRQRHVSSWSRKSTRELPKSKSDHSSLGECLRVHPSNKIPLKTDVSPRDIVRLKHCPQTKVNYNNPYRNLRSKDMKKDTASSAGRYVFNSVESYIHFNKIYPRSFETPNQSDATANQRSRILQNLPNIPRVNGFASHCTDTVLLKMMFEMNKPKTSKSVSKYSDVAVHKDLDEFMIVSTPTVSRSPSVASRKTAMGQKSKSQISFVSGHKEEDEKEIVNGEKDSKMVVNEEEQNLKTKSEAEAPDEEETSQHGGLEIVEPNDEKKTGNQSTMEEVPGSTEVHEEDGLGEVIPDPTDGPDIGQEGNTETETPADVERDSPDDKIVQEDENDNKSQSGEN